MRANFRQSDAVSFEVTHLWDDFEWNTVMLVDKKHSNEKCKSFNI